MTTDRAILWGLTPREKAVFDILMAREVAHKEAIIGAIWAGAAVECDNMLKIVICKMRPKLKPRGIRIITHRGFGYSIPPKDKAKAISHEHKETRQ